MLQSATLRNLALSVLSLALVLPTASCATADEEQPQAAETGDENNNGDDNPEQGTKEKTGGEEEDKEEKTQEVVVDEGRLVLLAPAAWKSIKPRVDLIEAEMSVPPAKGDAQPGRVIMMAAGGSIKANLQRWIGQFKPAGDEKSEAKVDELKIGDLKVQWVEIAGTFLDRRGPFAPATERADYRMVVAIIPRPHAKDHYFVRLHGPKKTMSENAKGFRRMIEELQWKE